MQLLFDAFQYQNALLCPGTGAGLADDLPVTGRALAQLPFHRVVSLDERQDLIALWRQVGRRVSILRPDAEAPPIVDDRQVTWLGLGLWWAEGSLLRTLLLPALGGAAGGMLAQGWRGGAVGGCIGLGLGLGEWFSVRERGAENAVGNESSPV